MNDTGWAKTIPKLAARDALLSSSLPEYRMNAQRRQNESQTVLSMLEKNIFSKFSPQTGRFHSLQTKASTDDFRKRRYAITE